MELELAVVFALVIAVVHFLAEELEIRISGSKQEIISFSSGISVAYIFVEMLPEFQGIVSNSSELIFVFPLLGFSSIHLIEEFIANSSLPEREVLEDYGEIHTAFLFLYHGALGYLLSSLLAQSTATAVLFFIPAVMHTAVSTLSISELHERIAQKKTVKTALSVSPLIGVILHRYSFISDGFFNPVFGLVLGMFFYVVIRDSLPRNDRGKPVEYLAGTIVYLIFMLLVNTF